MCTFDIKQIAKQQDLNIVLGIAQGFLAIMFVIIGTMNTYSPIDQMTTHSPWVKDFPRLMRFVGISELAGGLVLIISSLSRIKPVFTVLAALDLMIIMVFGMIYNFIQIEYLSAAQNLVISFISLFVVWGSLNDQQ